MKWEPSSKELKIFTGIFSNESTMLIDQNIFDLFVYRGEINL